MNIVTNTLRRINIYSLIIIKVYRENHGNLENGIDSRRKNLGKVKIQRGIFQGDALSPLLFVIAMMPLSHILRKSIAGHKLSKSQEKRKCT